MSCENCSYTNEWREGVDEALQDLRDKRIESDVEMKFFKQTLDTTSSDVKNIDKKLDKLITNMAVNDVQTNRVVGAFDSLSYGKIAAIVVSVLAIMSYWKG